jgi:protein-tyrosine-phosphatase
MESVNPTNAPAELAAAFESAASKPVWSLMIARQTLEATLKSILKYEGCVPQKLLFINPNKSVLEKAIPYLVFADAEHAWRVSSYAVHNNQGDEALAFAVLNHVSSVLKWYSETYLLTGLVDNFGEMISTKDAVLLYLSHGGTCRCAMANVITRHYIRTIHPHVPLRPVSAALHQVSLPEISDKAAQVLEEELGAQAREHKSIHANERYLRRADLLLPMDRKLRDQLITRVPLDKGRVHLFTNFFHAKGNIRDPFEEGDLEEYRRCFRRLQGLISGSLQLIIDRLEMAAP